MNLRSVKTGVWLTFGIAIFYVNEGNSQPATLMSGIPINRPTVNASVVITTGNIFQTVLAAGSRQSLTVQNNNATDSCWLYIGSGSATKGASILLLAGGSYTRYWPFTPNDTLQATCASSSDTVYIDQQ